MLLSCLLAWDYLHLFGGGLGRENTVLDPSKFLADLADIGPRTNTEVIIGEDGYPVPITVPMVESDSAEKHE
jgi:hypothetical protein